MNAKGVLYPALPVLSVFLLLPASVYSQSSFPSIFVPILPGILGPAPLPPAPSGPPVPGDTAIMTEGISEAGSTSEAGNTVQIASTTESAGAVPLSSSPLLLPPYLGPPTDTDLALASPFGGPGYVGVERPRTGASGRRYSSTRSVPRTMPPGPPGPLPAEAPLGGGPLSAGPLASPATPATPAETVPAPPDGTAVGP